MYIHKFKKGLIKDHHGCFAEVEVSYRDSDREIEDGDYVIESVYVEGNDISEMVSDTYMDYLTDSLHEEIEGQKINEGVELW